MEERAAGKVGRRASGCLLEAVVVLLVVVEERGCRVDVAEDSEADSEIEGRR